MTDMTFAPQIINSFLVMMLMVDIAQGRLSIFGYVAGAGLILWNGLLFYLDYRLGKQTPLTPAEAVNKYPELWRWYFASPWSDFWKLNDGQDSSGSET